MAKATEWYKGLEGKEVDYIVYTGYSFKGKVTGFDYYLGITIQSKEIYLLCYRGPMFPLNGKPENIRAKLNKRHRQEMAFIAKMVRSGKIIYKELIVAFKGCSAKRASAENCPFSQ